MSKHRRNHHGDRGGPVPPPIFGSMRPSMYCSPQIKYIFKKNVVDGYKELDAERLSVQLAMIRQQHWSANTVALLVDKLISLPAVVRAIFDQVEQLVRLLLVIPASSCGAARSFSSQRRLKTYLRSSMLQERLTHCAILHVHQLHLDNFNIDNIAINQSIFVYRQQLTKPN